MNAELTLIDGPLAGKTLAQPAAGAAFVVFPFMRPNDDGVDQTMGQWEYGRDGRFIRETVLTTTANADETRRAMEYIWRDWD